MNITTMHYRDRRSSQWARLDAQAFDHDAEDLTGSEKAIAELAAQAARELARYYKAHAHRIPVVTEEEATQ